MGLSSGFGRVYLGMDLSVSMAVHPFVLSFTLVSASRTTVNLTMCSKASGRKRGSVFGE